MSMREQAWKLLNEHVKSERLLKHSLAVEAGMITYAHIFGEDVDRWAAIGLLHDVDYEEYPDDHTVKCKDILEAAEYDSDFIATIQSHWPDKSGVQRNFLVDKALHACDEMCGFMVACAMVRDPKGFTMEVKSVKKKFKDKGFAKAINREEAPLAAEELGVPFDEHIQNLITGMGKREAELTEVGLSLM